MRFIHRFKTLYDWAQLAIIGVACFLLVSICVILSLIVRLFNLEHIMASVIGVIVISIIASFGFALCVWGMFNPSNDSGLE